MMEQVRQELTPLSLQANIDPKTVDIYNGILEKTISVTQLQRLLDSDPLTELLNTTGFERHLGSYLAAGITGVLIAIDVDDFKRFNDTLGHPAGDRLLKRSAKILFEQTRTQEPTEAQQKQRSRRNQEADLLGRAGGDEFLVFLVGASMPDAVQAAKRIRHNIVRAVRQEFSDYGPEQTMSLGLSFARPDDNVEIIRQRADQALYVAKDGKGSGIIEESIAIF